MSANGISGEEMFESLTGYDEIAISKAFGAEIGILANDKPTMFLRAMVFSHLLRTGLKHDEAKDRSMTMTLKECNSYFVEDNEVDPEEPVTVVGEDGLPLGN